MAVAEGGLPDAARGGIRCMLMRGGTSKGAYFLAEDLPADAGVRDDLLLRIMGSPDPRQIDGIGGAHPLTSKVAIVSASADPDFDVAAVAGTPERGAVVQRARELVELGPPPRLPPGRAGRDHRGRRLKKPSSTRARGAIVVLGDAGRPRRTRAVDSLRRHEGAALCVLR